VGIATGRFEAVNGGNLMVGGAGDDTYHVLNPLDVVLEAPGDGLDHIIASVNYALGAGQSVENLTVAAGSGGIALTGNALANRMVSSTTHADTLTGGAGNDTFAVQHFGDRVIEAAGAGTDRIDAYANHTLRAGSSVELIYAMGSAGRSLTGNSLANQFFSNAARADTLTGASGNDVYHLRHKGDRVIERAGGGTDVIYSSVHYALATAEAVEEVRAATGVGLRLTGNGFSQHLHGGTGRDTLEGGGGQDRLYGGADTQVDRFVFRSLTDSAVGAGRDRLYQFRSGIDDVDLRAIDANITRAGDQAFAFSVAGPKAFALWLVSTSSGVVVRMDATGDARPDSEILISGLTRAVQSDFLL
jgi:Ca2+-binding RTX toxin-like protein